MATEKTLDPQGPTKEEWEKASDEYRKTGLVELTRYGEEGWLTLTTSSLADFAHPTTRKYAASKEWVEHYMGIKMAKRDEKHFNTSLPWSGKGLWALHLLADLAWITQFGATPASQALASQRLEQQRKIYKTHKAQKALRAKIAAAATKRKGKS